MAKKPNPPRETDPLNVALLHAVREKPPASLPPARIVYAIRKLVADGYSDAEIETGLNAAKITVDPAALAAALKSVRDARAVRAAERAARKSAQQNASGQTDSGAAGSGASAAAAQRVSVRFPMKPASTRALRDAGLDYLDGAWNGTVAPDKMRALRQFTSEHGGTLETA